MIETVSFKNFKALRDVTVPLERFTVLVGPNASGKTSVLQGSITCSFGDMPTGASSKKNATLMSFDPAEQVGTQPL